MKGETIIKGSKELLIGYTTGSCAAAAATACTEMLLTNSRIDDVVITLPNGEKVAFEINNIEITTNKVKCSVLKDGGDDPDVTTGLDIFSECKFTNNEINLEGGIGVGRVTEVGLKCSVGQPAINPVPRKMIIENVKNVCKKYNYDGGIDVLISVPGGVEVAKKTFNPRLGIVSGISILGTTGIVEPMSQKALIDTIKIFVDKRKLVNGDDIIISPGNYGKDYCKDVLKIDLDEAIKFSNFIGETVDYIAYKGFKRVLLVGHMGKLIKMAGGIMNTHSAMADCRMEILAAYAGYYGADTHTIQKIIKSNTTTSAVQVLEEKGLWECVKLHLEQRIVFHLENRARFWVKPMEFKVIMF